ncbi:transcription initiation protein SPT3 homolog isoform X2 [Oscarella lobularis]|uniref:transcription initiation protein SPT3 homolog isoform X2 n=1 Tax=Oscarella lobularis TaxID=121494 RepID=UPI0033140EB3
MADRISPREFGGASPPSPKTADRICTFSRRYDTAANPDADEKRVFAFGDCRNPLSESAALIADVVRKQICSLLVQAAETASVRGGARFVIVDDIMFLLRRNPRKLKRAARFLQSKEMRQRVQKQASGGAAAVVAAAADEDDVSDAADVISAPPKRRKLAFDFLVSPDNVYGEIDVADEIDDDLLERLERADQRTRTMDPSQYLEYAECRQVNFYKKAAKFRDWLDGPNLIDAKPNQTVLELLGFLAYETVGELVNLALLVKRDMDGQSEPLSVSYALPSDRAPGPPPPSAYGKTPTFVTTPAPMATTTSPVHSPLAPSPPSSPATPVSSAAAAATAVVHSSEANRIKAKKRQRSKGNSSSVLQFSDPLRPEHIREAFRRHQHAIGPMSPYSTCSPMTVRKQSLCC